MVIKIVYFCYLIPNKWESIVSEQLDALYSLKNLYEQSEIYVSVIDDTESQCELEKLRIMLEKYQKIQLMNIFSENVYEYPGIKTVYELSSNNDEEYILYFHAKGLTSNQHEIRKKMFEYTIQNYEIILEEMGKNHEIDTASIIPSIHGFGYYNFFWARSSFINKYCTRPEISESYIKHGRFTWEMWLGNHYSRKNFIKTYSPLFKYNQVYDERAADFLMRLIVNNQNDAINGLSDSEVFINAIMNVYKKSMNEISDNSLTDKNTAHSYFDVYESLFNRLRTNAKNVLEVGIYWGGSIKLWRDYFANAKIFAVDVCNLDFIKKKEITNDHNISLFTNTNGYDDNFIADNFYSKNIKFDLILDDGPHTLESQCLFIVKYLPLLSENGIMVIEDVQHINCIDTLTNFVPLEFKKYIQVYDLRNVKGQYDDILFVINKNSV